jgi:Flp pilus assembly protein TadG
MLVFDRKRHRRRRRGAVIVEFALTVPFLFIIIFGVIDFSRAYAQLNATNAALREGARLASVMKDPAAAGAQSAVRKRVKTISSVFGYSSLDTNRVTLAYSADPITGTEYVFVAVTAHPVPLPVLGKFLGLSPFTVTRTVRYVWERTGGGA